MWTPKRVMLLSIGMVVFLAGYAVYAFFLGRINGMMPLPPGYHAGSGVQSIPDKDDGRVSEIDRKLQDAFGAQCPQIHMSVKFEIRKKNLVVAAAEVSFKEPDGRVRLKNFSAALFTPHADGKYPEITTVTSEEAILTFDQPISSPTDMGKGKIVGGELRGKEITVINNHSTAARHDDLEVVVYKQPLFFNDREGKIWTDGFVKLLDKQTQPHPTEISGQGLEILLAKEPPKGKDQKQPGPAQTAKGKNDLSGVEIIVLKSTVKMHLYTDSKSDFMNGAARQSATSAKPQKAALKGPLAIQLVPDISKKEMDNANNRARADTSHIVITTYGPFTYDVPKDIARFDSPQGKPDLGFPDQVDVLREPMRQDANPKGGVNYDHLVCDHLTLKFRRRAEVTGPVKGDTLSNNREIESAHATARPSSEVVLALDSENLDCHCLELIYQCPTADRGGRTVLRGDPLRAAKEGHKIKARELTLESVNQKGGGQKVIALGPGQVDLFDRNPGKGYTAHAIFKGLLTSEKYKEGDRDLNHLTLTDNAAFLDDEHGWKLFGERLEVWLEPTETPNMATPASSRNDSGGGLRQQPSRVEAYDRVTAESNELRISDCTVFKIRFKDVARAEALLPGAALPGTPATSAGTPPRPQTPPTGPVAPVAKQKDKGKIKKPIDLRARDITADVLRGGDKQELQEVVAVGNVRVHQDGDKPTDKGVDIKGDTLNLLHFVEGDILTVYGDASAKEKAQMQLGELYLVGPKVTINQKENIAAVKGTGAMQMPSNTTFEGGQPTKATVITIHFMQDMFFNGRSAEFNGKVVALQDNSTLRCQQLEVQLDRTVSLKEGQKSDQSAKVDKIISSNNVQIFDESKNNLDQLVKYSFLACNLLNVDKQENIVNASGPGVVASLQYGTPEGFGPGTSPKQPKTSAKPPELMLTRVDYTTRMFTTQPMPGSRKSVFYGPNVRVVHVAVPANTMTMEVNVDPSNLPKGALWLQCGMLTVLGRQQPDGKTAQIMKAENNVDCRTADMFARANIVEFDETQDTVTFRGLPNSPAILTQQVSQGGERRQTSAEVILYNRKTNTVLQSGTTIIKGG